MTSSDGEHIAPVINLFGDRSGTKHTETTATSSEESTAAGPRGFSAADATEAPADPEVLAPVRALPTLAGFSQRPDHEQPDRADSVEELPLQAKPAQTKPAQGQSKAARRQARDGFSEVSRVSMRALARRGMSSYEMTQFLGTREFEADEIEGEVERLEGSGLLDDAALAETLTRTLRERKGLGASAISAELRRRKIDQEHISAVLDVERDEEQERANEIALKRAPQLRSLDSVTAKRRLSGFLMRKGYSGSIVSAAVTAALAPRSGESSGGPIFR
ncbi:regulatory protein RecX [Salinibacterium sp. TMP30]|uniref:regulatory protein RecX n=1 Tax=Salinibacterium sp. TMP30 TaxID=3138237 RepID=UPI003139325A